MAQAIKEAAIIDANTKIVMDLCHFIQFLPKRQSKWAGVGIKHRGHGSGEKGEM